METSVLQSKELLQDLERLLQVLGWGCLVEEWGQVCQLHP